MDKAELIITALKQRIGQMASEHAIEVALLRSELTELTDAIAEYKEKEKARDEYSKGISEITK
jgi:phage host-nuclease inhibitor protein Gam